ncbi:MAG: hypothetical protein GX957_12500 [Clostridiaceae bacterium]|nr:hypothetical protein [Clostridiaceae bacterium]
MNTNYSVRLEECDKITAIKIYREITRVGLKEAKDVIDNTPGIIFEDLSLLEANEIIKKFRAGCCDVTLVNDSTNSFDSEPGNIQYEGPDISKLEGKELLDILKKAKDTIATAEKLQVELEGIEKSLEEIKKKTKDIENKSGFITYLGTIISAVLGISMFKFIGLIVGTVAGWFVFAIIDSMVNGSKNAEKAQNYYNENYPPMENKKNETLNKAKRFFYSPEFTEAREVIPNDYFDSISAEYLVKVVENKRADSIKEALNLYEEYLYRSRMEEMQRQQVEASQEAAKAQQEIAKAAKEQVRTSKQIARNTRATTRAVRLNTFINLMKK